MLEAALAAAAATGATTLVAAMATDTWAAMRAGVAKLFGQDPAGTSAIEAALEQDAALVAGAGDPEQAREDLLPAWRRRLGDYLAQDPAAAAGLQGLVDQVHAQLPAGGQSWVVQHINAYDESTVIVAGRDVHQHGARG